jgi:23S rRNA pseudouridine1911/1915/1917 synthase
VIDQPLEVLFEDNHCLAVAKPAGALMVGDETGDETLLDQAKEWLRQKYNKPGNVFLGVVHRLDRPVSGVALYARTSKSASRLAEQFRVGSVRKIYNAWVDGSPPDGVYTLTDWLLKNRDTNTTRVAQEGTFGAKLSTLDYRVVARDAGRSLLEIALRTGRSHQIRVQLSSRGWPILGDLKYRGPQSQNPRAIALHARSLTVTHPTQQTEIEFEKELPRDWSNWFNVRV